MDSLEVREKSNLIVNNIGKVIVGKERIAELLLTALFSGGHVLLEDVPGTGKTKLAKTLAISLDVDFSRIQFTPDLLPSDITGLNVYNRKNSEFELKKGPVFTNILLADEINRATPRTQAGLLECMEEKQVTIDGETHLLEEPFFVIATQNPLETAGTFPLPEAQLDRFMMKLSVGMPSRGEEVAILERFMTGDPMETLGAVINREEIRGIREGANRVYVHPHIEEYMVDIVSATRNREDVVIGASPRATLSLLRSSKVYAALQGRDFVIPDDIKKLAVPVLSHRLVLSYGCQKGGEAEEKVKDILRSVPAPTEDFSRRKL